LNFSAQDPLSYLAKRLLKAFKAYSSQRTDQMIVDLVAYANTQRTMNLITQVMAASGQTSTQTYLGSDRSRLADLIDSITKLNDKCDYYVRNVNGQHVLYIYGGQIKPAASKSFALEYGGNMNGYSVQYMASTLGNDVDFIGANGLIGNASSPTKQTEYDALYQTVEDSDQVVTSALINSSTQQLKDTKSTKVIPTLVTKTKTPIKDFDYGDQFTVAIDDWYVQVNQTGRVVGWQLTVGEGDDTTTVIYTKDTEGVT
jgi:hypothetical protein